MTRTLIATLILMPAFAFAAATKLPIDTQNSSIKWKGSKAFVNDFHTGTVNIKDGFVMVDGEKLVGGEFNIDMESIKNEDVKDPKNQEKLVGHLKSADFFDTANHKTAKYVIKKVTQKSPTEATVDGELTVRGKTQPMSMTTTMKKEGKTYVATGKTDFDRTKYDVKYNSQDHFPNLIKTGKDKIINNRIDLDFTIKTLSI